MFTIPRMKTRAKQVSFSEKRLVYLPNFPICEPVSPQKRLSEAHSSGENAFAASLTVEAAISFTLFFALCGLFLSFFTGQLLELRLQKELDDIGETIAVWSYTADFAEQVSGTDILALARSGRLEQAISGREAAWAELFSADTDWLNEAELFAAQKGTALLWQELIRAALVSRVGEEKLLRAGVKDGGAGLSLRGSMLSGGDLDLVLRYTAESRLKFPFPLRYPVTVRSCRRLWIGTGRSGSEEEEEEPIVYVTEWGSVYHRSTGCRVLNIHPQAVAAESVTELRNTAGGKYYPCEHCCRGKKQKSGTVYLTEDGDRYHKTTECGAISRALTALSLSEAELKYRACRICGGKETVP